jgi:DNA polymerase-3 subunit gamma/tau
VIAFAGNAISVDDVTTVLGLVGRDLLFDLVEAVVDEDAPKAFSVADRAVEAGHELRLVLRELSRVVRDVMIVSVDPSRAGDGELAETERERLRQLAGRFSREDLMRAFDLLSKAEVEIRTVAQPRYYFEMVLLRWMHLRKLVPLAELLEQMGSAQMGHGAGAVPRVPPKSADVVPRPSAPRPAAPSGVAAGAPAKAAPAKAAPPRPAAAPAAAAPAAPASFKDAFLAEVRAGKGFFYNTVVAQAQRIDVGSDGVTFSFLPTHRALREQFEQARGWLEQIAGRIAGRNVSVVAVQTPTPEDVQGRAPNADATSKAADAATGTAGKRDLKAEAMSSSAVQAMLDVFPAEIRDVEEM